MKLAGCVDVAKILLNHHHRQDSMLYAWYLHEENKWYDWSPKVRWEQASLQGGSHLILIGIHWESDDNYKNYLTNIKE